jgi:hypothetical protein
LSFGYKLISGYMNSRARTEAIEGPDRAELLKRLADLVELVRVLERIVTDDRSDLKRQFKDLEAGR